MKKRIFAAFVAAAMSISVFTAFAEYDPDKILTTPSVATKVAEEKVQTILLNGAELQGVDYIEKDGNILIPLRVITEKLGFVVEWIGDGTGTITLTRGPLYITMNAFKDEYTFSRMAPVALGVAPWLDEGITYVPTAFIDQVLGGASRENENGSLDLFDQEHKDIALIEAIDAENKQITVKDIVRGSVVLNLPADVMISDEKAETVKFEDLKTGMTLRVSYSDMMTRSLPPQNTPHSVVVLSGSPAVAAPADEEEQKITGIGKIESINVEENSISIKDTVRGEVVLMISETTRITDAGDKAIKLSELKAGDMAEVEYGPAMTMSLPPINNPISIKISADKPVAETQPVEKPAAEEK